MISVSGKKWIENKVNKKEDQKSKPQKNKQDNADKKKDEKVGEKKVPAILKQLINDDKKWRKILRGLNRIFYHQTVSSKQIEEYISKKSGINLTKFWDQYLRTVQIPTLEYKKSEHLLSYRYTNMIENFRMPIIAIINGEENWIYPTDKWKTDTYADEIKTLKKNIKTNFFYTFL